MKLTRVFKHSCQTS